MKGIDKAIQQKENEIVVLKEVMNVKTKELAQLKEFKIKFKNIPLESLGIKISINENKKPNKEKHSRGSYADGEVSRKVREKLLDFMKGKAFITKEDAYEFIKQTGLRKGTNWTIRHAKSILTNMAISKVIAHIGPSEFAEIKKKK